MEAYPHLTREDIQAAIGYAAETLSGKAGWISQNDKHG
ncbi:MAG: DUF433 domain-containing protein [Acidobacteriota bacterium]